MKVIGDIHFHLCKSLPCVSSWSFRPITKCINGNAPFRWSFRPNSEWGSKESTTVLTTHPGLVLSRSSFDAVLSATAPFINVTIIFRKLVDFSVTILIMRSFFHWMSWDRNSKWNQTKLYQRNRRRCYRNRWNRFEGFQKSERGNEWTNKEKRQETRKI